MTKEAIGKLLRRELVGEHKGPGTTRVFEEVLFPFEEIAGKTLANLSKMVRDASQESMDAGIACTMLARTIWEKEKA